MAKYYTDAASTPVFAVTFVSNRDGIVSTVETSNDPNIQKRADDINNEIKALDKQIAQKEKEKSETPIFSDRSYKILEKIDREIKDLRAKVDVLKDELKRISRNIKDEEYLIYSNLEIKNVGGSDLSQQSNWYLTDAEVELTRDWPICKAKLVVTCKINDDGTIPSIVNVEKGFTYDRDKNDKLVLTNSSKARLLSADDEVRIYAGYKSEPCITVNDLDKYPYSFTNLVKATEKEISKEQITQLQKLEQDKKKVQDAINQLNGPNPQIYLALIPIVGPTVAFYSGITDTSGRQTYSNNAELLKALNTSLLSIDKLIQTIQVTKGLETKSYTADPNKLSPIFWGFIDTIDFIGSSNSIQIIYNLRDRSRILADTKLITIPYLNENKGERGAFEGLRHKTLEGVYRAANGGIYLDNNYKSASGLKWREGFDVGEVITLYDNKIDTNNRRINDQTDKITEIYKDALAEERIKFSAAIEDPARWVIANSFLQASDIKGNTSYNNYDPLFHIWTLQPPLVSGSGATTMQIINKSPFEILGYMQVTEVMPIDYYCSHVNGHFIFGPRILDTSGLDDLDRGNRTYFFFDCFDKLPESRSLIKNIRVQTSTIGVYNRFTVAAADFNNATNASLSDLLSIVDITPVNTRNRKIPIKQHIITDPKIAKEANKEGAAQALALTTASNMARDNTTIIMKVLGDASFNPGEAIRVFNTVLHSKDTFTFNGQTATSSSFLKTLYEQVEKIKAAPKAQVDKDKKIANLSQVLETIRDNSGSFTDDLNNVLPMYKVRAITHTLKATGADAGFITKIVAIADIL